MNDHVFGQLVTVAIGQVVTLLTLVLGFVWQWFREKRNREWEIADRAALAAKVDRQAATVAATVQAQTATLHTAIRENTDISTQAFKEANSVNVKIAGLGLEHNQLQRERQANEESR